MKATVLFAGAGGSSVGLHDAGYDVTGYEYWQPAVDTHRANGMPCELHDLSDATRDHLIAPCNLLWASPPCQSFSAAGKGLGADDPRDGFPWTLRIIGHLLPSVVIIENVKGLTFAKHADYFRTVLVALETLGYDWDWRVLCSADYGVPQTRERCYIVARRDGAPIVWPAPTHTEHGGMFTESWVTMAEALGWGMTSKPFGTVAISSSTGGPRMDGCGGSAARAALCAERDEGRWVFTRPATTIAGDTRVFQPGGHHQPGEQSQNAIRLTIDELATLQGFPTGYVWCGTKTAQARQVGNAVTPVVAEALARANRPDP